MHNILNTRPAHQSQALTDHLKAAGNTVFQLPLFDIIPVHFNPAKTMHHAIFIFLSANAVRCFFSQVSASDFFNKTVVAIGPATLKTLAKNAINHALMPAVFSSEGILAMPLFNAAHNQSIALICGENTKPLLQKILRARGAQIHEIICYRRHSITYDSKAIFLQLQYQNINSVISTSSESLFHLVNLLEDPAHKAWLLSTPLCVISHTMKMDAEKIGFLRIIQADDASDDAIVHVIKQDSL